VKAIRTGMVRALALALSMVLLAACGDSGDKSSGASDNKTDPTTATGGTFKFGVMLPLTGQGSGIGESFRRGIELAVKDINAGGGAGGMQLEPVYQDHLGTAEGGASAANKLINLDKLPYVIASFSSVVLATAPVAARSKVLVINAGGSDERLLNLPYVYNNQMMAKDLQAPLLKYVMAKTGAKTAALITSDDAYGVSGRKTYKDLWPSLGGGEIVADEVYALAATDMTPQLEKIKSKNPDVVLMIATGGQAGVIVKQARSLGLKSTIAAPLLVDALLTVAGPDANGVIDSGMAVDPAATSPEAKKFLAAYTAAHNAAPDWLPCTMGESVYLLEQLLDSVTKAKGDPKSGEVLMAALEKKPTFANRCANGEKTFQKDHSLDAAVAIRQVVNGKFTIDKIEP
jgi:branched-chain amino acid transport system substrate-binding protein